MKGLDTLSEVTQPKCKPQRLLRKVPTNLLLVAGEAILNSPEDIFQVTYDWTWRLI